MVTVKWDNGNYVTYQESNGNWIVRDKTGHQIGIYVKGGKTARYLTNKYVTHKSSSSSSSSNGSSSSSGSGSSSSSSGSSGSSGSSSSSSDSSTEDSSTDSEDSSSSGGELKWVQKTVEEPITNYEDAVKFGKLEVNKARRNNGHSLECKVIGNNKFKDGEWCLVQIPSFNINDYMYITKVDHSLSANDEWVTSLTLVDYPPSFGSGESNKLEEESDSESADNNGDTINTNDTTGSGTSTGTTSSSSSGSSSSSRSNSSRRSSNKNKNGVGTRVNTSFKNNGKNVSSSSTSGLTRTSISNPTSGTNWSRINK